MCIRDRRRGKSYNKWLAEQRPSLLIDIQAKLAEGKGLSLIHI